MIPSTTLPECVFGVPGSHYCGPPTGTGIALTSTVSENFYYFLHLNLSIKVGQSTIWRLSWRMAISMSCKTSASNWRPGCPYAEQPIPGLPILLASEMCQTVAVVLLDPQLLHRTFEQKRGHFPCEPFAGMSHGRLWIVLFFCNGRST